MKLHCCPQTGIHFLFFPGLSLCTITLIRMGNNVLLTPIVLTVCRIFHSSGASHYLASQILSQGRSMPASQVYQWQRGLRPWPHTSKLKQSKSSPLEYYEPLLRCDSDSLSSSSGLGLLILFFFPVASLPFFWIVLRFSFRIILQDIPFIHPTTIYCLLCLLLKVKRIEQQKWQDPLSLGVGWF